MLSKVLSKEICKDCKFCCVFEKDSLWETPVFPIAKYKDLIENNPEIFQIENSYAKLDLEDKYDDNTDIVPCPFLDENSGCTLSYEDKPLECKIWPLRVMRKDDQLVVAFETICKELGTKPSKELIELVEDEICEAIRDYAYKYPFIAKEYDDKFPIILNL